MAAPVPQPPVKRKPDDALSSAHKPYVPDEASLPEDTPQERERHVPGAQIRFEEGSIRALAGRGCRRAYVGAQALHEPVARQIAERISALERVPAQLRMHAPGREPRHVL